MASLVRENPPLWNPCVATTGSTEHGFAGQRKPASLESLCAEDRVIGSDCPDDFPAFLDRKVPCAPVGLIVISHKNRGYPLIIAASPNVPRIQRPVCINKGPIYGLYLLHPLQVPGSTEYGFAGQRKSSSLESLCGDDRIDRIWLRWSEKILLSEILTIVSSGPTGWCD